MLNPSQRTAQPHPISQPRGKTVCHGLIPALDPEYLWRPERNTPELEDCGMPDYVKRRRAASNKAKRGRRSSVLLEEVCECHLIEMVQPRIKRRVLVLEALHVTLQVEHRKVPPGLRRKVIELKLIEAHLLQDAAVRQHFLGAHLALEKADDAVTAEIRERGQIEFLH